MQMLEIKEDDLTDTSLLIELTNKKLIKHINGFTYETSLKH